MNKLGTAPYAMRKGMRFLREINFSAPLFFLAIVTLNAIVSPYPMGYFDISFLASGGATLAIASVGQTLVILSGGFDLSAGAVIGLVNSVLAKLMGASSQSDPSVILWTAIGIGIGGCVGAFNGFFIAFLRLQPIVVTLATMFMVQGSTRLILPQPGGGIAPGFSQFFMGDALPNLIPASVVLLLTLAVCWLWLKRSPFGLALYASGSDSNGAEASGVRVAWVKFMTYTLAGGCYGLAGVFVSAQTGSGDPLIGNSLLLPMFAAVVIGGTRLGGGKGGPIGSIFGAYILMVVVNTLLTLNVSAYYATIAEGFVLLLAVLFSSIKKGGVLNQQLGHASKMLGAWRRKELVNQRCQVDRSLVLSEDAPMSKVTLPSFFKRHGNALRYTLPSWVCLVVVIIATAIILGNVGWHYVNSLLVLSTFLAILALGQGTVILTGGLDLSIPWTIALCGAMLTGIVEGQNIALWYALPIVLLVSVLIGFLNGVGVVALGLSPIVVTLAMNGILQGLALIWSNGSPSGFTAPALRWLMTGNIFNITPVILFLVAFVLFSTFLLGRTVFGRYVYAIGNSLRAARLSGVRTGRVIITVYILSSVCAALVAVLLTGFSGQASLGMGDDYLLPSIAVVVIGGALITGGRGQYLGMLGGALLLTAMQTLLAGTALPSASRAIFFGAVVLVAVIALKEKKTLS